ncbi:MAG: NAD(P)H-hydrate epimerase [Ruminococcaceae bacterium]|nr:NAD(P)H-hydrate epimerase [Oscillospiraceae bacterium]
MRVVSVAQMKEIEKQADLMGHSYYQMMENAGFGAYKFIKEKFNPKSVTIFCGNGNNAGDGFVVARYFANNGVLCNVVLCCGYPKTEDACKNYELLNDMNVNIYCDFKIAKGKVDADVIIDAIYGTGFHGEFKDEICEVAKFINSSDAPKVALDIPSGLNADLCVAVSDTIKADFTLSFDSLKYAHKSAETRLYTGKVMVIDIKIPKKVHKKVINE